MTLALIVGAGIGAGLFLLARALFPSRPGPAATVARVDARSRMSLAAAGVIPASEVGGQDRGERARELRGRLGVRVAAFYAKQGWEMRSVRADLSILERPLDNYLAQKVLLGLVGLFFGPMVFAGLWFAGFTSSPLMPLWLALVFAALFFVLPDLEVKRDAKERRAEFLHTLAQFLGLVGNSLAGGRGLPEALRAATELTDTWQMVRLRRCLADARRKGISQAAALEQLGEEIGVTDLREIGSAISLSADDGARIRESLMARASTLRERELAETEGQAGAQSQMMLVAQIGLLCGLLIFLIYPAITAVTNM
ncbi:type II secretion system F family protein [Kitasatospora sp. NPDC002227]|uniref:type II secretion system F family protein n=1 Tax=Kitasatospora sp. NPDC002227 TaxID=3154773 RepID=UPI003317B663